MLLSLILYPQIFSAYCKFNHKVLDKDLVLPWFCTFMLSELQWSLHPVLPHIISGWCLESQNRIIESLRLEKNSKIIKSNRQPATSSIPLIICHIFQIPAERRSSRSQTCSVLQKCHDL